MKRLCKEVAKACSAVLSIAQRGGKTLPIAGVFIVLIVAVTVAMRATGQTTSQTLKRAQMLETNPLPSDMVSITTNQIPLSGVL